ncbi:MAG: hypothetical protein NT027_01530 [Proteobacteria bacterium]|nr:hypothetical protein [Pseudomonadota bacterium]
MNTDFTTKGGLDEALYQSRLRLMRILRQTGIVAVAFSACISGCKSAYERTSQTKESLKSNENSTPPNDKKFPIVETFLQLSSEECRTVSELQFVDNLKLKIDRIPEVIQQTDSKLFKIALFDESSTDQVQMKLSLTKPGFLEISLTGSKRLYLCESTIGIVAERLKGWISPYLAKSIPRLINSRLSYDRSVGWNPAQLDTILKNRILEAHVNGDSRALHSLISSLAPWNDADPIVALVWSGWLAGLLEPKDENRVWLARGVFDLDKKNQRSFAARALVQEIEHFQTKLMLKSDFDSLSNAFGLHGGSSQHSLALSATLDPRLANFFGHVAVLNPDIKSTFVEGDGIPRELEVFLVFAILPQDILTLGTDEYNAAMAVLGKISQHDWPTRLGRPKDPSAFDIETLGEPRFQLEWRRYMIKYYWTLINDHVVNDKVIKPT